MGSDAVPLADLDFKEASQVLIEEALSRTKPNQAKPGEQSWQFKEGFKAYTWSKPLRMNGEICVLADSRELWRLGWLTAMFIDLNLRETIITTRTTCT
jgi:hypothetical protein